MRGKVLVLGAGYAGLNTYYALRKERIPGSAFRPRRSIQILLGPVQVGRGKEDGLEVEDQWRQEG